MNTLPPFPPPSPTPLQELLTLKKVKSTACLVDYCKYSTLENHVKQKKQCCTVGEYYSALSLDMFGLVKII